MIQFIYAIRRARVRRIRAANERVEARLAAGRITAEEAVAQKRRLKAALDSLVVVSREQKKAALAASRSLMVAFDGCRTYDERRRHMIDAIQQAMEATGHDLKRHPGMADALLEEFILAKSDHAAVASRTLVFGTVKRGRAGPDGSE